MRGRGVKVAIDHDPLCVQSGKPALPGDGEEMRSGDLPEPLHDGILGTNNFHFVCGAVLSLETKMGTRKRAEMLRSMDLWS